MFPDNYDDALIEWSKLRDDTKSLVIDDALHTIHDWWQQAPMVNHHLHFDDYEQWPMPWDLLADNLFCEVAKCLGIVYTIILVDRHEIYQMNLLQTDNYTYVQVLTDSAEYILNDQLGSIKTDISEEKILHKIDCSHFRNKLL